MNIFLVMKKKREGKREIQFRYGGIDMWGDNRA